MDSGEVRTREGMVWKEGGEVGEREEKMLDKIRGKVWQRKAEGK